MRVSVFSPENKNNGTCLGLIREFTGIIHVVCLEQCLAYCKSIIIIEEQWEERRNNYFVRTSCLKDFINITSFIRMLMRQGR